MPKQELSILILTHNEEKNISKCIESILPLTDKIYIVDSGSSDATVKIAQQFGAQVEQHPWTTYADQFNWGLDHFKFETEWVMRMDADEEFTPGLVSTLDSFLKSPPDEVNGVYIKRRVYFMGKWIKHGGYYPTWLLRVFRKDIGRCEALWMDEHIVLTEGNSIRIEEDIIDKNNKDLTFWTDKHNKYASREVLDILNKRQESRQSNLLDADLGGTHAQSRRWLKDKVYGRMPLFLRPFAYFMFRYFIKLGFLDGKEGFIFHTLQGFWYRFLVDAKLYEYENSKDSSGK